MTLEEIKEQVAKEHIASGESATIEQLMTEVAKRHSQQYIDANKELSDWQESMMKLHNELDLQSIAKVLDLRLGSSIAPQVLPSIKELQQSNKELVEMLRQVVYEYEQGEHSFKTILEIKELLNKQS